MFFVPFRSRGLDIHVAKDLTHIIRLSESTPKVGGCSFVAGAHLILSSAKAIFVGPPAIMRAEASPTFHDIVDSALAAL